jgi:polygalacturonase
VSEAGLPSSKARGAANKTIALKNSYNVTLRDFSILAGGHIGILATGVDNLTHDNLKIDTNRDGINIDAC